MDNFKITQNEIDKNNVKSAANSLRGDPEENKNVFDRLPELIAAKFNAFLDELNKQLTTIKNKVPTKTSQLENDSKYIKAEDVPVKSVNGQTGDVKIELPDNIVTEEQLENYQPKGDYATNEELNIVNDKTVENAKRAEGVKVYVNEEVVPALEQQIAETEAKIPTKTSQLDNDSGYLTAEDIPDLPSGGGDGKDGYSVYKCTREPWYESTYGWYELISSDIETNGRELQAGDFVLSPSGKMFINTGVLRGNYIGLEFYADLKGADGTDGDDGVGIESVVQTTTSLTDGGTNIVTVTLTNGVEKTFQVLNGSKGSAGKDGQNGKDGVSVTHSWNGTTLTVTSASGTSSANLKGDKGDTGSAGSNGADGTSVTVTNISESTADGGNNVVTFSDGKTLTVKNGSKGSTGAKGADGYTPQKGIDYFDGQNGKDGKTPVKGTDYWTAEDKQTIVAEVQAEATQIEPLYAESVEWLETNGDTSKVYVLPDGFVYACIETVTEGGEPLFTNALDSVAKNINKRWSRSSKALSTSNGYMTVTIPVTADQTVYVDLPLKAFQAGYSRIHYLDSSNNYVNNKDWQASLAQNINTDDNGVSSWVTGYEFSTSGDASSNTRLPNADNITQMVVVFGISYANSGTATEITEADIADIILSVGNPIEYSTGSIVTDWTNTGHGFVPANYDAVIASLQTATNQNSIDILELKKAVENGKTGEDVDNIEYIKNWDSPIYDKTPVFQLTAEKSAVSNADRTVEAVYAKYDALLAANTDFITKTDLGVCSDGVTHIYRYDFRESEPHTVNSNNWSETKPKIIIVSGVHREWGGIYSLYNALEEITTNSDLDELRRNLHLIVVPIMNPYCIIGSVWNKNYNGIEVRRNFEVGFEVVAETSDHYAGTTPLSEVEAQYIDNILKTNTDAAYFLSCHSMTRDNLRGTGFMWCSSATKYMCNMGFRIIDKMSKAWHKKYGTTWENGIARENDFVLADKTTYPNAVEQAENDYRAGWASLSTSAGTEQRQATKYGIQATNFEVCDYFRVLDNSQLSATAITHGAETYINFLLTAMGIYDHKDKEEYYK